MDKSLLNSLKTRAHGLEPIVRIGKGGITTPMIEEIHRQLQRHKLIKIRYLRSFVDLYDTQDAIQELSIKTNSTIIDHKGNTVVLYRGR